MDLRRSEYTGLQRLAALWKTTPGAEFEAMLTGVDLTAWQDVIQYLRSLRMRENPQIVKMNICLSNNIRLTLEGAGAIQAYCRDNRIQDKPFVAMLKESITDAEPVNLESYAVKAKLKREVPLAADDDRVKEVLARWDSLAKHFRMIQRFEFVAPGGVPIRFDVSIVRENAGRPARTFQEANIIGQPDRYEIEVELTANRATTEAEAAARSVIRGVSWMLQGRQRSFVIVSNQAAEAVRGSITELFGLPPAGGNWGAGGRGRGGRNSNVRNRGGPTPSFRFPGPQPATLERKNMRADPEPGVPNVRSGYNVTDKADGLRCLLYVDTGGKIYLVDGGGRVYATGRQADAANAGTVLDGEWIRRGRDGSVKSHYMAFDILALRGDVGIAGRPFMIPGAMAGSAAAGTTRMAAMLSVSQALSPANAPQRVANVPAQHNIQFGIKSFRTAEGVELFREAAAAVLEDAKAAPYNTDGLIFTPNADPLPIGRGTWADQLKWKPPHENTIDFLVIVDKERTKEGGVTGVDAIGVKYREDSGQTVRYKTLRLFVGSNRDKAFADPRKTILGEEALPASVDEGEWREVEFRPSTPRDPMAAICYAAIGEGSGDPARATTSALAVDDDSDIIRCTRSGDIIQSNMIVEMAYHPERAPGWRWEPTRVRHDKTERWLAQQAMGARKGGTMNADWVANAIWTSIHNPVTEEAVRTGILTECEAPAALEGPATPYSVRRTPRRDLVKVQCLTNFHEDYIKRSLLLNRTVQAGVTVCDLAMGRGEDITKWIAAGVGFVLGCDANAVAINDPRDGAYRVLMDKMIALGGRGSVPSMVFAQADMARRLPTGEAGLTDEDQTLLQREFGAMGHMVAGADVVSCMFAAPYMFRDADTLAGFLNTLADTVKVGGLFVGCGMDGDATARLIAGADGENTVVGRDGRTDVWSITKRYGSKFGDVLPVSDSGLGAEVDVDFIAAGERRKEYLVSWPYFQRRLAEVGLEPLTPEELTALGLPATTQMFSESWSLADRAGKKYEMTDAIQRFSFLNRWWVLRRRTDRRPAPPKAAPALPVALTQLASATEAPSLAAQAQGEAAEEAGVQMELPAPSASLAAPGEPFLVGAVGPDKQPMDDLRLGEEFKDWQRYLMMGAQSEITDEMGVKYPSVIAAIAGFKINSAPRDPAVEKSASPNFGEKLFGVSSAYHQEFEKQRAALAASGVTEAKQFDKVTAEETDSILKRSAASGKYSVFQKKYGLLWDKAAWDAVKLSKYQEYLAQRFEKDERFRRILQAIVARGGEILVANGNKAEGNDLGVGVDADGRVIGGENALGKMMMALASGSA
jgi:hypothetical protein